MIMRILLDFFFSSSIVVTLIYMCVQKYIRNVVLRHFIYDYDGQKIKNEKKKNDD